MSRQSMIGSILLLLTVGCSGSPSGAGEHPAAPAWHAVQSSSYSSGQCAGCAIRPSGWDRAPVLPGLSDDLGGPGRISVRFRVSLPWGGPFGESPAFEFEIELGVGKLRDG